jgi:NAD(P)-dependent dehydrogenase (short-subunit alcohol dehydrogenase family)
MELDGKVVVVTGGAGGIGRALVRRFAAAGAARVIVADLSGVDEAADGVDVAIPVACDVTDEADVLRAIAAAEAPVDLFCANAGVADGIDEQAPDELWDRVYAVNVRAHVIAARLLVPDWLSRGEGYFLSTASAAGLLTQIGSAPYAVTKHAAVAFAEWLSITYGGRGIGVSCLCPMGVNTNMLQGGEDALPAAVVKAAGAVLEPDQVADAVVEGLRAERFLILPHPEVLTFFQRKANDYERWLAGMRRLQANVDAAAQSS